MRTFILSILVLVGFGSKSLAADMPKVISKCCGVEQKEMAKPQATDESQKGSDKEVRGWSRAFDVYGKFLTVTIDGEPAQALIELLSKKSEVTKEVLRNGTFTVIEVKGKSIRCLANIQEAVGRTEGYQTYTCTIGVDEEGNVNDGYKTHKGGAGVHN